MIRIIVPILLLALFWIGHYALGGLKWEHLAAGSFLIALYYGGEKTRPLYRFALPIILFLALYDSQGYFAHLIRAEVHVEEPYLFDQKFFGITTEEGVLVPAHWMQAHTYPALDFITGLVYLLFIPVFVVVGLYFRFILIKKDNDFLTKATVETKALAMMWGMFWLNILSSSTYYWYPAAPPWYVELYGLGPAQLDIPTNAAGGLRFDALLGINMFADFYAKSPNIFGAIPSTHVAYPFLATYFAFKLRSLKIFCLGFYLLMVFSAVYLNHHYILDIIWGSAYALIIGWAMNSFYTLPVKK